MRALTTAVVATIATLSATQALAFATNTRFEQRISWATDNLRPRGQHPPASPTGYWRDGLQKATDRINQNPTLLRFTRSEATRRTGSQQRAERSLGTTDNGLLNGGGGARPRLPVVDLRPDRHHDHPADQRSST